MKVPISWLKDYVDITMSPADLAELVTNAGMEVETVEYIGIEGASLVWDREKILLGQILQVEQHPNADTLVLATVGYGADEPKVVVTGAPNLHPFIGAGDLSDQQLYGAIIFEGGTYLNPYKNNKPTKLKGKALRGIENNAMLCSEVELAAGEDHEGIMIMRKDENTPHYIAGTPLQDILGDAVLDIDIIPNIARCASIVGIAREVAALTGQTMRYPSYDVVMEGAALGDRIKITTEHPDLNPRFTAILIEGVEQKPSPYWMQRRLALAGQRAINVVVDISN
ncbi:MAG: phenylalanine--tRNA ligase beta subunit-related protein, partial [Candidatus Promineifilaceae bacterium]